MLYQNSPWLDRDTLSKKQLVKYKARDGLTIMAIYLKQKENR